jgi:hypothetical protein
VGLATDEEPVPSPPPTCPTIINDVGIPVAAPGATGRLFVRLIVRLPGVVVITTGDQFTPALRLAAEQLAGALPASLHENPHIDTVWPSGNTAAEGLAVRLTDWACDALDSRQRIVAARTAME